jgi:sec-independent protein translocase protein TatB
MFDFTSSKLLILGIVALLVIGPKDLPALLRTIGKYVGIIKRQAAEFRAQFDEAMRESELSELKKSVESIQQETEASMREATSSVEKQLADARQSVDGVMEEAKPAADPIAFNDGLPTVAAQPPTELNGASHPAETPAPSEAASEAAAAPAVGTPTEPGRATEKSGA